MILITGANRGIGQALTEHWRAEGAHVLGTCRSAPPAENGWVQMDVTQPEAIRQAADTLAGKPVDLLVCNAGVYLEKGHTLETGYTADLWARTFAVNVTGVFLTVQAFLPNLRMSESPRIAIIGSMMASHTRAPGGAYIYRSSKAAVLSLGRNLSADLAAEGIAVGVYEPGWVQTDMGGSEATYTIAQSVAMLARNIAALNMKTTAKIMAAKP